MQSLSYAGLSWLCPACLLSYKPWASPSPCLFAEVLLPWEHFPPRVAAFPCLLSLPLCSEAAGCYKFLPSFPCSNIRMLFELIEQDRKLTLLSYLFLQVGGVWPMELKRFLSKKVGKKKFHVCVTPPTEQPRVSLMPLPCSLSILFSQAFLPSLAWSPVQVSRRIPWQQLWQLPKNWPQNQSW